MKNLIYRLNWHLVRSPLAGCFKFFCRLNRLGEIRARRQLLGQLPATPDVRRHVEELNRNGYTVVTDLVEKGLADALATAGQHKLDRISAAAAQQNSNRKDFWVRLLDEDKVDGKLRSDNPFVRFALQKKLLAVIAQAFGEVPLLDYVLLTYSKHTGDDYKYSQLWHRDHDDTKVIKLFVYLTDVNDTADGPFTFFPGPESDKLGFQIKSHQPDAKIFGKVNADAKVTMLGRRLSAFIVETTRCLHMGSRVLENHSRLLYTATFYSAPRLFPEPPARFALGGDETPLERKLLLPVQ